MGDGDDLNVPIPGVPDQDQVLDGTSDLLLGLPQWAWTIIAAIIMAAVLKAVFNKINFKVLSVVLVVLFFAAYMGLIGKGQ